ncbi:MAG: hypothetical protein J2P37_31275 [Ktedonobacteraceae bacterium]|nr:hypothetical protein [Ktedonobacteraceae bacterium]
MRKKKNHDLSAQQAMDEIRSWGTHPEQASQGESEIVGAIFDQDEARKFLEWLGSPEARAIGQRLREKKGR